MPAMFYMIADTRRFVNRSFRLGQELDELGHEGGDVADKDAQDAPHNVGIELLGRMRDNDVGDDGRVGGEVELHEAAVLVLPHEPAGEEHGIRVVDGVLRETDTHGCVRGGVDDDEDRETSSLDFEFALKDGGLALIARLTNLKARDVFLLDVFLECFGRLCHDQSPPAAVEIKIIITY